MTLMAGNDLVEKNLPLVGYAVSEMYGKYPMVDRDELISSGMEGLVLAARTWDPNGGSAFGTWARLKIRWHIQESLRAIDWMERRVRDRANRFEPVRQALLGSLGREATDEEVASAMGINVEEVTKSTSDPVRHLVPMDETLSEVLAAAGASPEQNLVDDERTLLLHRAVKSLPERTRTVVVSHYFQGVSQSDIARQLGVSDATVSAEKTRGLHLLQQVLCPALGVTPDTEVHASVRAKEKDRFLAAAGTAMTGGIVSGLRAAV